MYSVPLGVVFQPHSIVSTFAVEQQSLTDRRGSLLRKVLLTVRLGNQLEWKPTKETHNLVLCFQMPVATVEG